MSLWLFMRKCFTSTGCFIKSAWVGGPEAKGLIIGTSHILAAVYERMRSKYHGEDDTNNWRVMFLQEFDLLENICMCDV